MAGRAGAECRAGSTDGLPLAEGVRRRAVCRGSAAAAEPPGRFGRRCRTRTARRGERRDRRHATCRHVQGSANSVFVGPDPCAHPYLKDAPGQIYVYDPPDGSPWPRFRFLPDTTTPIGLVTNAYGFRGGPVTLARQPRTIRIAFPRRVDDGGLAPFPYSYPEHVGYWLNRWAAAKKLDLRFEVLNAGRESIGSPDIAAIMKNEVAPLAPDLVVYYEGANQFYLEPLVPQLPPRPARLPVATPPAPGLFERILEDLSYSSALAMRLKNLLAEYAPPRGSKPAQGGSAPGADGREWPKPDYALVWPKDVDEQDPDLARKDLPATLSAILADLGRIEATTEAVGGELALASFKWLVEDGMVLDPVRHRFILEYLNFGYAPFRYRDLARLARFQNRVLEKYAKEHRIDFLDVARLMPSDPDLFIDAIHGTTEGVRLGLDHAAAPRACDRPASGRRHLAEEDLSSRTTARAVQAARGHLPV